MPAFNKILVPTDFSPAAEEAFRVAVAIAKTSGSEVVVAHVTLAPAVVVENGRVAPAGSANETQNLWNLFREFHAGDSAVRVAHEVVVARRASAVEIESLLEKFGCDLMVIGSRGHGRLRRFFRGSLTDEVLRRTRCPVLVVKTTATRPSPTPKPATPTTPAKVA